jgi:hypothetical protein
MGTGDGDDPRSPVNRGWGWGWTPDPRRIGDGDGDGPPIPGKSGMGMGMGPRSPANRGWDPHPHPRANRGWGWGWGSGVPCPGRTSASETRVLSLKPRSTFPRIESESELSVLGPAYLDAIISGTASGQPTCSLCSSWGRCRQQYGNGAAHQYRRRRSLPGGHATIIHRRHMEHQRCWSMYSVPFVSDRQVSYRRF